MRGSEASGIGEVGGDQGVDGSGGADAAVGGAGQQPGGRFADAVDPRHRLVRRQPVQLDAGAVDDPAGADQRVRHLPHPSLVERVRDLGIRELVVRQARHGGAPHL
ncbi:MAG TPA: hypothetical protein VI011_01795 [Asanoa sp.]